MSSERPFKSKTLGQIYFAILTYDLPRRPDDLCEELDWLWEIIVECWAKDPLKRPSTQELIERLHSTHHVDVLRGVGIQPGEDEQSVRKYHTRLLDFLENHSELDLTNEVDYDPTVWEHHGGSGAVFKGVSRRHNGKAVAIKRIQIFQLQKPTKVVRLL